LPTLDLSASRFINGRPNQAGGSRGDRETVVGLNLNIPVFEGFARNYKIDGAQAQVELREAELRDVQAQVLGDIATTYAEATTALRSMASSRSLLEAAQRAVESVRRKYDAGAADIVEMLNAQSVLSEAELERIRCLSDWRSARLRLLANAGEMGRSSFATSSAPLKAPPGPRHRLRGARRQVSQPTCRDSMAPRTKTRPLATRCSMARSVRSASPRRPQSRRRRTVRWPADLLTWHQDGDLGKQHAIPRHHRHTKAAAATNSMNGATTLKAAHARMAKPSAPSRPERASMRSAGCPGRHSGPRAAERPRDRFRSVTAVRPAQWTSAGNHAGKAPAWPG
jgi:hypothetical protein